jgi:6-phosphogluconolactonase
MITDIKGFNSPGQMALESAELITGLVIETLKRKGSFNMALSGGTTPRLLYEHLASPSLKDRIDWSGIFLFWSDERVVPKDSWHSNFNTAWKSLISMIPIPRNNVLAPNTDLSDASLAAADYEKIILAHFSESSEAIPQFDLIMLGMGPDGHTASLFPGHWALEEKDRLIAGIDELIGDPPTPRVTFTLPLINNSQNVLFLVSGPGKSGILNEVFRDPLKTASLYPAAMVHPLSRLYWRHDVIF